MPNTKDNLASGGASGSGLDVPYPLMDQERRAMDAASVAMEGEPDALALMSALCRWPDPPPADERWERKIAAACEIAVAFCKLANNRKLDTQILDFIEEHYDIRNGMGLSLRNTVLQQMQETKVEGYISAALPRNH